MIIEHVFHSAMSGRTHHAKFIVPDTPAPPQEGTLETRVESFRFTPLHDDAGNPAGALQVPAVPVPRTFVLDPAQVTTLVAAAAAIEDVRVPARRSNEGATDGWSTTLTVTSGFSWVTWHWFCDLPPEWAALAPLVEAVERTLAAHSPED